jgi:hypothetical protein
MVCSKLGRELVAALDTAGSLMSEVPLNLLRKVILVHRKIAGIDTARQHSRIAALTCVQVYAIPQFSLHVNRKWGL